jgi:hypothetical protein
MITREQVTFTAQGDDFFPSKVAAPYSEAHDPGVIGRWGRYKDKPVPYGVADFCVPDEMETKIPHLHSLVTPFLEAMRAAGAEEFRLHITYHYQDQCSLGFSKDEATMIAELCCDVLIDCCRVEAS